jgi:hypothetical protein
MHSFIVYPVGSQPIGQRFQTKAEAKAYAAQMTLSSGRLYTVKAVSNG